MSTSGMWGDGTGFINIRLTESNAGSIDRANKLLRHINNGSGAIKAVYAALKRAGERAKTEAGRFAAQEYTLNKGSFMSHTNMKSVVHGGSGGAASVSITFAGSVIPLLEFSTHYSRGGHLTTTVKRSGGAATLEHAFAVPMFGPVAVFEHINQTRGPVEQKFGPSTGQMMQNDKIIEQMEKTITETFDQRIDHEISRILAGYGG